MMRSKKTSLRIFFQVFLSASALTIFLSTCALHAQNAVKSLRLRRVAAEPRIDGLVDAVWSEADSVSDFVQFQPYHGMSPSRRTVAKLVATNDALFCLILSHDDPENVQTNTGLLDDFGGDVVSLMIDTFGDRQTAYKFAVSAGGVRADCRLLDDARNRDYSWDGVWFSAAETYAWGFAVEMRIPFRSIQYEESLHEWGLDFDRWRPVSGEDIYWNAYEQNEGQRISRFGRLIFTDVRPTAQGLGLEIYPVALMKAWRLPSSATKVDPDAGLDLFYNPSQKLTVQLTANPDFAQIEADPYEFNISRYETYYSERRPFFTEGKEVFMASGKQRNSGFYSPLELFYSRRIGRLLPDGNTVPLLFGAKAFARLDDWEYGGFVARTGETESAVGNAHRVEPAATFAAGRVKKTILGNSSIGGLTVASISQGETNAVLDLDGAFRAADWQLAWQLARSQRGNTGDMAASWGFTLTKERWAMALKGRAIGNKFDIDNVGFVPWRGLSDIVAMAGPRWYFESGTVREISTYGGFAALYEHADLYTDHMGLAGFNMQFRRNWGFELNFQYGRVRDEAVTYDGGEVSFSTWFAISPHWDASAWGGIMKSYNFNRKYAGYLDYVSLELSSRPANILRAGASVNLNGERDHERDLVEFTINTRPFLSITPVNDLNVYLYVDLTGLKSSGRVERIIGGLLFAWQFQPKSWLYIAINEFQDREQLQSRRLFVRHRAAVLKLKYLYYL